MDLVLSPDFARDRTLFVAGLEDGLRVSTDRGLTWHDAAASLSGLPVHGVAVSAESASDPTVYLATSDGIRVSHDGGSTWHPVMAPLDGGEAIVLAVSPTYANDRTIFVATTASTETVVWRSTDGGQAWHRWLVQSASGVTRVPLAVASSYAVDGVMFVGLGRRIFRPVRHAQEVRSGERRPIWQPAEVGTDVSGVTALAVSPAYGTDRTVFAATNAGVFVSRNGGERFEAWNKGLDPARMVSIAVSPEYPQDRLVYGLGLGGTVWRRRDLRAALP